MAILTQTIMMSLTKLSTSVWHTGIPATSRMPKSFTPDLKKKLKEAGCYYVRPGKGDHERWYSPVNDKEVTVDGCILSRHLANEVLKQAGLPKSFR